MFYGGEKAFCKSGKYKGQSVIVERVHICHNPSLYTCMVINNGKQITLYENELESLYQHDMRMLDEWKKIVDI
jgi:hypothetical protein